VVGVDVVGVLAAARGIRPYLDELVGAGDAAGLDAEVAEMLTEGRDPTTAAQQLSEVLRGRVETRMFLAAVLDDAPDYRPPQWQDAELKGAGFSGMAGDQGGVIAPLFRCPKGNDYDWRRPGVGTPVPVCPTHLVVLVRA
jgi:hypothetical protein